MSPGAVGGEPSQLAVLAAGGAGQAFTLDHRARVVDLLGARHAAANAPTAADVRPAVAGLRWLAARIERLDRWVGQVAAAFAAADATGSAHLAATSQRRLALLEFGPSHPLAAAVPGAAVGAAAGVDAMEGHGAAPLDPAALPVERLDEADLDRLAAWPRLPMAWRDRIHRERLERWAARLEQRIAAVPQRATGPSHRLVAWFDRHVVDLVSPVTDLHVTRDERIERLRAEVVGVRRLLAAPDLTVLSFDPETATPTGGPALRVALGDVDRATHLAVLAPGTATGLHRPWPSVADAHALHAAASAAGAATAGTTATVLDLHDAPADLGLAADARTAAAAAAATGAFLDDLPPGPTTRRTTLVGHSYGALTAAHTTRLRPVDALVLLGAPGVGVAHRDELMAGEVWAARAPWDPIALVADLDELMAVAPWGDEHWRDDPDLALGPDPADPEFGALRLPTTADGLDTRGHLAYLDPGAGTLSNVARVVAGTATARPATVRPATPPRRDRPG